MDFTATDAAQLTGVSLRSIISIYLKLRRRISLDTVVHADGWRGYDGTTSYEHNATTLVTGDASYSVDFTNTSNWTFTDGNGATTYSQVLSNAQFVV